MFGWRHKDTEVEQEPLEGDLLTPLTLEEDAPEEAEAEEEIKARPKRGLAIAVIALLLCCIAGVLWLSLRVRGITVSGSTQLTEEQISTLSGIQLGDHMWSKAVRNAAKELEMYPYIAVAKVVRVYPDRIRIVINERREAAVILGVNTAAIVDDEGYVLSIGTRSDYTGLLKVYGAGSGGYRVNGRLGEASDFTSATLLAMISAVRESGAQDFIESVDISNALNMTMQSKSGYTVKLGQPEGLTLKLRKFLIVLPEVQKLGYTEGTIDVSTRTDPVFSPPGVVVEGPPPEDQEAAEEDNEYTVIPSDRTSGESGAEDAGATPTPNAVPEATPTPEETQTP